MGGLAIVDVRDVARGHIAAGFGPSSKVNGQRFILKGASTSIMNLGAVLKKKYPPPIAVLRNSVLDFLVSGTAPWRFSQVHLAVCRLQNGTGQRQEPPRFRNTRGSICAPPNHHGRYVRAVRRRRLHCLER